VSFGTLVVIVLAGLGGPLLAMVGHRFVPVVIGELIAGIIVGPQVLGAVDPHNATIAFLGEVGFAMLMLTVGMHLPLRDRRLAAALRGGAVLAGIVCVLAIPAGILASEVAGTGHAAVFAVLLASGSAAVLLPAIQESGLEGRSVMTVMAQVTIADVLTILSVPIVLQPSRAGHAVLGTVLVAGAAAALLGVAKLIDSRGWANRARRLSKQRHWALDLRVSLVVLFLLAWLAEKGGTSILVAGFGAGVMVALLGGPKRLSTQVRGIADGFFIPLYFVVLGARLDLGGLVEDPTMIGLTAVLVGLNVVIHVLATTLTRRPLPVALAATAQLGVPAAVASLGLSEHLISPVIATAIVASALLSLAVCTVGVDLLAKEQGQAAQPGGPGPAGEPSQAPASSAGATLAP
jgi:Kef-type K+ transport system membrane component KefB